MNNQNIHTRVILNTEAKKFLEFVLQLDNESEYLLFNPNERQRDIERVNEFLFRFERNPKSFLLVAEDNDKIVGYICAENPHLQKINHILRINLGLLMSHRKLGIDRILMAKMLEHAKASGIKRIEASIIDKNTLCANLCKKFNGVCEGVKRRAIKIDGKYHDEHIYGFLID